MLSLATHGAADRAPLAALRLFFSGLAAVTVATTLAALVSAGPGGSGFALAALIMSGIAVTSA